MCTSTLTNTNYDYLIKNMFKVAAFLMVAVVPTGVCLYILRDALKIVIMPSLI